MFKYRLTAVYRDLYSTIICSIICNRGLFELMHKTMLPLLYTFYELNRSINLVVQNIALLSQRDVKTMLSVTKSEQEICLMFSCSHIPLMSKPETYFNADFVVPI